MYLFKKQFHSDAYFIALILMAISLPLSKYAMSVMQFTLIGLWLWSGFSFEKAFNIFKNNSMPAGIVKFIAYVVNLGYKNIIDKFRIFFRNKAAMVLVSLFLIHLIGLIHTSDFGYAFKDLRIKLPLLALPIIISTMEPLSKKRFNTVMILHAVAVIIGTLFSTYVLLKGEFTDIRKISVFISHIRFSLNICIAIFTLLYFVYSKDYKSILARVIFTTGCVWLISFLFVLESGIGLIILLAISFCIILYFIFKIRNTIVKTSLIVLIIALPVFLYFYFHNIIKEFHEVEKVDFNKLESCSDQGNPYVHDTVYLGVEDGKYVGLYLCMDELRKAWNKRSDYDFDGQDKNNQQIKYTIIRFLTSKGYRKDAEGVNKLTGEEVKAIENGIANINYLKNPSIKTKISKIMIGYHNFKYAHDPNGSSVLQRIEYWKASIKLIKNNLLVGVGTGDLNIAFDKYYDKTNSPLDEKNRWRSHNQYLSIFVGLGIFGFLWFLFTLFYPPIKEGKLFDYFYFVFFITILLSMLTEDTIESQAGVTFFAFFNSFLLFGRKKEN